MTTRPTLTPDHYLDAIALCRATLHRDDPALLALARTADVGMMVQALVHLHLHTLGAMAGGDAEAVDRLLLDALALMSTEEWQQR